ncbi:MAG: SpoIIE family protein phosphatase [Bacteroidales bacterium]|nr:SpoIIE family protein phosphatase [Bacteroidales bacterium]
MRKHASIISLLLSLLATLTPYAQPNKYGVPIITNYEHYITKGSEQNWCITQDFRGVMYVGNMDKGVLEYDGVEWRRIPIPNNSMVRSMVTGDDGIVYIGAEAEFGHLVPDGFGNMHYRSLSDSIDTEKHGFGCVWKTYYERGKVYYCTYNWIFEYNPETSEFSTIGTSEFPLYSFFIDHTLYVGDFGSGLMKYERDTFIALDGGEYYKEMNISGLVRLDSARLLVGTYLHGLTLFDTERGTVIEDFIEPDLNNYFKEGVITYLHPLNNDFVVASQFNGLVILDREGKAKEIITEDEEILNQTIPFVYSNEVFKGAGPVWIAHFEGISKLETNNPFRIFTEESGFEGFITDIVTFNDQLFISTFGGLYYKNSTATGTRFIPVPEIQDHHIRSLHVFNPAPGIELLLVSTTSETFVFDKNLNISTIFDRIINPPEKIQVREDYGGYQIAQDPKNPDVIYTGIMNIIGLQYMAGRWKEIARVRNLPDEVQEMVIDKYGYLWTKTINKGIVRLDISLSQNRTMKFYGMEKGLPANERNQVFIDPDNEEILLGTMDGFYRFNYFRDTLYRDTIYNRILPEGKNLILAFDEDRDGDFWFSFENAQKGWMELVAHKNDNQLEVIREKSFLRLPNASADVFYSVADEGVWFSKSNELYHFDKSFSRNDTLPFRTLIRKVYINNDSLLYNGTDFIESRYGGYTIHPLQAEDTQPLIRYRYNNIEFRWAAPFFEQEDKLLYRYWLEGFENEWSAWTHAVYKDFTNLPYGQFIMHVKAKNIYGDESKQARYTFEILKPWYATYLAVLAYIILSGLVVYVIIKLYTRRLKQENIRLEGIIEERTAEIRKQKEELTDSIEYASRIQRALLPSERMMDEHNIDHFILFRPRDIVSGDFYWMGCKNDKILIVAADCTGHGVPGAFMSMLGMTFLDEIVIKAEITSTDEILEQLRERVITSLKQSGKSMEESTKDGMDLAMITLDLNSRKIQYSGAYNPLYLVRKLNRSEITKLKNGEDLDLPRGSIHDEEYLLQQIRADQMPIGISEKSLPFNSTIFKDEGFNIYLFSDGFLDQFGGPQGKKFMSKNFKKMILELQSIPLKEQGAALEKILLGWMGEISQIDDILVMGLRMNPS